MESNDAYVLVGTQDDASTPESGGVRIVPIIGAISREYHTSVLDVLKMPWCLFMALVRDLADHLEKEKKEYEKSEFDRRRNESLGKNSTVV